MRINLEDVLVSENAEKNAVLIEQYNELQRNVFFFEARLVKLKEQLRLLMTQENNGMTAEAKIISGDIQTLTQLVDTLTGYLDVIKSDSILGFKTKKMTENDLVVLERQVKEMRKMRALITTDEVQNQVERPAAHSSDQLSQLITDAEKLEYNVTKTRVWARRGINLLTGLVAAVAIVAVIAFMMTPAGHITLAAAGVVIALRAAAAFFGIGKTPVEHAHLSVGPFPVNIATPVPSTAGALAPALFAPALVKKLRITNPPREEAARNMQAATINQLTNELNKKIGSLGDGEVKTFLLKVVAEADKMYNAGIGSWFYESQKSKMEKARLILREVAKIMEGSIPETVDALLHTKINSANYTFGQLLNAQRNASFFSNRTSTIAENCGVDISKHQAVDLTAIISAAA